MPFIQSLEGKLSLSPAAEEFLLGLDQSRPVSVLAIVGKYRTGKSFFLNRVVLQRQGFSVGHTINPCTKGLQLWAQPLTHSGSVTLVVDVEGFGGIDENPAHDARIFLAALMLSSYLVYNSAGVIDENSLNSLAALASMARELIARGHLQAQAFPSFLWVIRDFAVKLVDRHGDPITERQYLEKTLEEIPGMSEAIAGKNRIRKLLR